MSRFSSRASFSVPPTCGGGLQQLCQHAAPGRVGCWENQRDSHRLHALDLSMSQLSGSSTSSGNGLNGEERLRQTLRCPESQTASPCRIGKCNRLLGSIASEVHLQSSSASKMQEWNLKSHVHRRPGRPTSVAPQGRREFKAPELPPRSASHAPPMGQGFIPSPWALGELGLVVGGGAEPLSEKSRARPQHF